jgi:protein-S-isoprenylcysteine O-methyltransferase Ste14
MSEASDASSSFPWPPFIFATAFAVASLASWKAPLPIVSDSRAALIHFAGLAVVLIGLGVALAAEWRFLHAGTATLPTRATTAVVTSGIYRLTRNPMYLGLCATLAGVGLFSNSGWFLLAAPLAVAAVTKLAIEREELYLERKFGPEYLDYKKRTRRWL